VTITLAIGVSDGPSSRHYPEITSCRNLGSTTVICSDKTGTLTENQMTVQAVYTGIDYSVSGVGYGADGEIYSITDRLT